MIVIKPSQILRKHAYEDSYTFIPRLLGLIASAAAGIIAGSTTHTMGMSMAWWLPIGLTSLLATYHYIWPLLYLAIFKWSLKVGEFLWARVPEPDLTQPNKYGISPWLSQLLTGIAVFTTIGGATYLAYDLATHIHLSFAGDSSLISFFGWIVSIVVGAEAWEKAERNNLSYATSTSKVYRVLTTDEGQTFIIFGGDSYGQVPANNINIYASFRVGGGKRGNLARGTVENIVSSHSNILSITNPAAASGGDNPQSMKSAKAAIPAALRTLERAVTEKDHADLALAVSGVAKARATSGLPLGSRTVAVTIAPTSGGQPTSLLRAAVSDYLRERKMVTSRIRVYGPSYREIRLGILLHVNKNFRAVDAAQVVRKSIINNAGTGILDFDQLNFGGVQEAGDGTSELFLAQTRLQGHFDRLTSYGVERAEIFQLDVIPMAEARPEGNSGDGVISSSSILLSGTQRRRRYKAVITSAGTYDVYEYILGKVSRLSDAVLIDETKTFEEEAINFSGYKLIPLRDSSVEVAIESAAGQEITLPSGLPSLYSLTGIGNEYLLYNPVPTSLAVGSEYTSPDGSVRFTLTDGATPFIKGDYFYINVYPVVGDVLLEPNEYPFLLNENLVIKTSGGART
jgi:hypothetical protein